MAAGIDFVRVAPRRHARRRSRSCSARSRVRSTSATRRGRRRAACAGPADKIAGYLRTYADLGVDQIQVGFVSRSADELCDQIAALRRRRRPARQRLRRSMPESHMPEAPLPGSSMLEGKVALVSGIGPGMGRDISLLLARHGADVVLGARRTEKSEEVAAEVRALGRRAEVVAARHHRRRRLRGRGRPGRARRSAGSTSS